MSNQSQQQKSEGARPAVLQRVLRRGAGWIALAVMLVAASWSGAAHAQRGEAYTLQEELQVRSGPDDGFPGVFDTQLVKKGAFVANLPLTSVYYGVTRELTLGTILLSYLPLVQGTPSGSIHARYRIGSTSWFRTTADVLLLGEQRPASGPRGAYSTGVALLGSNTQFALSSSHQLTLNTWFGHVAEQENGGSSQANVLLMGGTYSLTFAHWGALHLTALYLGVGNLAFDNYGGGIDLDFSGAGSASDRIVARGTISLRAGSWLFNIGAARLGAGAVPWLNIAFEVGG